MQTASTDHLIDRNRPETNGVELLSALAEEPLIVPDVVFCPAARAFGE